MQDRSVGVQHSGQITHDAYQRGRNANGDSELELDLDIAQPVTMPPMLHIVIRPDTCVDKVEGVEEDDPEDEARGSQVAVLDVPDKRSDAE